MSILTLSLGVSNIDPLSALLVGNTNGRVLDIRLIEDVSCVYNLIISTWKTCILYRLRCDFDTQEHRRVSDG